MPWDVFKYYLEDQAGNRVEIARKRLAAEPQRLQWNRATAGKRIDNERRFFGITCLYEPA